MIVLILAAVTTMAVSGACNGVTTINVSGNVQGSIGLAQENSAPPKMVKSERLKPMAICDEHCGRNDPDAALDCCRASGLRAFSLLCVNSRVYCV